MMPILHRLACVLAVWLIAFYSNPLLAHSGIFSVVLDEYTPADTSGTAKPKGPPQLPKAYRLADFHYDTIHYAQADTLLFGVWRYDPIMQPNFRAHLGVAGSASRSLWGGLAPQPRICRNTCHLAG